VPSLNVRTAIAAIHDPIERGGMILATVNRNVDVLENELSHGRIDQAAYEAGRTLQAAYERLPTAASGSNWRGGDRIDPVEARNLKEDRTIDALDDVADLEARARLVIGSSGVNFLSLILRDGLSLGQLAARGQSRGSRADVAGVANHFRRLLRYLAEGWAAQGPDRARIRSDRAP
jgi:hypothetical protein